MFELSFLQRDALMEIFNIGVGRASRSLAQLLGCDAAMSVPIIMQASVSESGQFVDESLKQRQDACMVSRQFGGIETGAVVIFQGLRDNVAGLLDLPASVHAGHTDIRQHIASKIALMVTDSCADQIEDLVRTEVPRGPVKFQAMIGDEIFDIRRNPDDLLIIVKIDIALRKKGVTGHLLLSFSQEAGMRLAEGLDRMLSDSEKG